MLAHLPVRVPIAGSELGHMPCPNGVASPPDRAGALSDVTVSTAGRQRCP